MTEPVLSGPRSIGDSIADRMKANERHYEMRFMEAYRDALTRLQRDGDLPPGSYDVRSAPTDAKEDAAQRLLSNLPLARATRDETREWFKGQPLARQALVTTFHLVRARQLELARTVRLGDDGERVRLRGVVNGRSDRLEARYTKPTSLGDVEVDTTLRRGLERPGYAVRVGLRAPCGVSCTRVDLVSERRDDHLGQRQVVALGASRVYNNGVALFGSIERVKNELGAAQPRVSVGLTIPYL